MYKALYLSPMIPSFNLPVTVSFLKSILDFSAVLEHENYFVLIKNNLTIHILNAGEEIGEMEFYMHVDDVDSLWNEIKDKLTDIKVKEPFDREYGMREFHLIIPETKTLLFVGHVIKK